MGAIDCLDFKSSLILKDKFQCKRDDFVGKEVKCPEIRRPIIVNQSPSEGKEPTEHLFDSIDTSSKNERTKRQYKWQNCNHRNFSQPGKLLFILIMSLISRIAFKHIVFEYQDEKGDRTVQINVLEVEQK